MNINRSRRIRCSEHYPTVVKVLINTSTMGNVYVCSHKEVRRAPEIRSRFILTILKSLIMKLDNNNNNKDLN